MSGTYPLVLRGFASDVEAIALLKAENPDLDVLAKHAMQRKDCPIRQLADGLKHCYVAYA